MSGPFCQGARSNAISQTSVPLAGFLLRLVATGTRCCDARFVWVESACSRSCIFLVGSVPRAACLCPVDLEAPVRRRSAQARLPLWRRTLGALGLCGAPGACLRHPALWAWVGVGSHWAQGNQDRAPGSGEGRSPARGPSSVPKARPLHSGLLAGPAPLANWGPTP